MRILLVNPPYHAVTSLYGVGEQIPLGLLSIGGPLLDEGHDVTLLDAEVHHLSIAETVERAAARAPDVILTGHAGEATPFHRARRELKAATESTSAAATPTSTPCLAAAPIAVECSTTR